MHVQLPGATTPAVKHPHDGRPAGRVAIEKAKEAGKPEAMLEKIADGTVQKFLKEVTLLSQPFVKDDKQTVEQVLKAKASQCHGFTMFVVGEGIEKKVTDFAAEVAAASKV